MTLWVAVLLACALAYATKLAGHLVPARRLEGRRMRRVTGLLPVALLTSLVVVQTFGSPTGGFVVDARVVGLGAAVVALLDHGRRRTKGPSTGLGGRPFASRAVPPILPRKCPSIFPR